MANEHPYLGRAMTPKEYAEEWQTSAQRFHRNGHYSWMAEQLGVVERVLEVGCGSGEGTVVMAKQGIHIMSVEINPELVTKAIETLRLNGISVEEIKEVSDINSNSDIQVRIVHGSIFDELLTQNIGQHFDAIVCWMTGASPMNISTHLDKPFNSFDGSEMPTYRKHIHQRCFVLGSQLLKPNGIVHIVDRLGISSWSDKDHLRASYADILKKLAGTQYAVTKATTLMRKLDTELTSSQIQYVTHGSLKPGALVLASARGARI